MFLAEAFATRVTLSGLNHNIFAQDAVEEGVMLNCSRVTTCCISIKRNILDLLGVQGCFSFENESTLGLTLRYGHWDKVGPNRGVFVD